MKLHSASSKRFKFWTIWFKFSSFNKKTGRDRFNFEELQIKIEVKSFWNKLYIDSTRAEQVHYLRKTLLNLNLQDLPLCILILYQKAFFNNSWVKLCSRPQKRAPKSCLCTCIKDPFKKSIGIFQPEIMEKDTPFSFSDADLTEVEIFPDIFP